MPDRPQRLVFGEVAATYDARRPTYPDALLDDLAALAGPGRAVVEAGAGTGKATRLLAGRGLRVLAVEPNAEMAAIARETTRGLPGEVTVVESDFETLSRDAAPDGSAGLVCAGQAWHWVAQPAGYIRARALLYAGGVLAPFWNRPQWLDSPAQPALSEVYARFVPELPPTGSNHPDGSVDDAGSFWAEQVAAADGFDAPEVRTYAWEITYTTAEYAELLRTFSAVRLLEPERREAFVDAIRGVIDDRGATLTVAMQTFACLATAV